LDDYTYLGEAMVAELAKLETLAKAGAPGL
jgi:hypothetical protein